MTRLRDLIQVFPFVSKHGLKTEKTLMPQNYTKLIFVRGWQKLAFPSGASSLHRISDTACRSSLRSRSHSAGRGAVGVRRLFWGRLPFQKCPCYPIATLHPWYWKVRGRVLSHLVFARFQFICATPGGRQRKGAVTLSVLPRFPPTLSVRQRAERVSKHESNPQRGELLICWLVNPMMHLWCGNIKLWWWKKVM